MKTRSILVLAVIALCTAATANAKYSGGTGTPEAPYRIATAEDLNDIGNHEEDFDKDFILVNDVNLAAYTGTQFKIIGNSTTKFTGVFNGNGHKVWNFTWTSSNRSGIGLFGYLDNGGQIKNLGMENVNVNAEYGWEIGGLVGENSGTITNCYSTGGATGEDYVGGLVGENYEEGTITNCYSTASTTGQNYVGGLVGWNYQGTITNCYSTGGVTGNGYYVGGLAGENSGTITNCYSTGSVTETGEYVGGLVGENSGTITNCYSTGSVSGNSYIGGLVGYNSEVEVVNSFWDIETSGQTTSAGGTGKTTAEMKTKSTFTDAGWDFVGETANGTNDYWRMCVNGEDYPLLSWQKSFGGDFVCPDSVDIFDLSFFIEQWLDTCTAGDNFCKGTDIKFDGKVDLQDFAVFTSHWMEGP
jgi:hypothetical protein